jgi:hypothetical protein
MLDDRDKKTLVMAEQRWKYPAARVDAIRETFGETETRFWQRVHALLRDPEAAQWAPTTVSRLLRLEAARRAVRSRDRLP